ncbi:MAG: gliding motility-associated C-terminal domain-containing protein [Flavobacteriales bacterium]|nr:gliding motility-associated C-terminal domain-containing protein [Flavobacteriales bacterium]
MAIQVNALPTVIANAAPSTTVCNGDMVTLTGGGATSYTWSGGVTDGVAFAAGTTTNYIVTGTDGNGCINTNSVTITVNNCTQPTASFTPDSLTICAGGDILFTDNSTGTGITTWVWDFDFTGLGGVAPATANTQGPHNVTYNTPGSYSVNLSVTDANGTHDTTIIVTVTTCSNINAGFTTSSNSICAGDSVVFTDATTGGTPTIWQWDFDLTATGGAAPGTAINQGPHTVFFNNPGIYTIELIVFDGTVFDTTISTITVIDCSPTANFSASNTTLCEADCITFTDLSTGTPTSYLWSFPGGTPATATGSNPGSICYAAAGNYNVTLTVTNQYGVDNIVMTNLITVNLCTAPIAGIIMDDPDGEICDNSCIDFTYDGSLGGTPTTLTWTFPGGTPSTFNSTDANDTITVCWNDTSGTFNVGLAVSNANGSSNANTNVVVHLEPIVNAGLDTSITIGANGFLNAVVTDTAGNTVSGGTFGWTPTTNLTDPSGQNTTVTQPLETNTYTVTYTDQYGCVVTDDIIITVDIALNIGVPSAFSPNGDGSNDFLLLRGKVVIQTMNLTIYNRYGQKVFETTDIDEGWDGTHNGNELNPGVFVYYVNVTFIDGTSGQLKGNVTLVR